MSVPNSERSRKLTPEHYKRLKAEAEAPYRGLRQFVYISFGASGFIGAFVFLMQLLAGKGELGNNLTNLLLQVSVVAVMVGLFRFEQKRANKKK